MWSFMQACIPGASPRYVPGYQISSCIIVRVRGSVVGGSIHTDRMKRVHEKDFIRYLEWSRYQSVGDTWPGTYHQLATRYYLYRSTTTTNRVTHDTLDWCLYKRRKRADRVNWAVAGVGSLAGGRYHALCRQTTMLRHVVTRSRNS